ncbi:uncharacterized protein TNCV_2191801 [Trichonephila clavipes]|nr:uncharacterized protein TNCV_2191801 [Trichonephila clavipes]
MAQLVWRWLRAHKVADSTPVQVGGYSWCGKRRVHVTVLEAKREEFVDDALMYAKNLCEELEISFEPPRRIRRKHVSGDGSKDVQKKKKWTETEVKMYEDDLRRTMFSSIDKLLKFDDILCASIYSSKTKTM